MTDFLSNQEIFEEALDLLRDLNPNELREKAQRERVLCKINTEVIGFELKVKVGHNAHALIDPKRKEIKTVTYDGESLERSVGVTEDEAEELEDVISTLEHLCTSMERTFKHHRGESK